MELFDILTDLTERGAIVWKMPGTLSSHEARGGTFFPSNLLETQVLGYHVVMVRWSHFNETAKDWTLTIRFQDDVSRLTTNMNLKELSWDSVNTFMRDVKKVELLWMAAHKNAVSSSENEPVLCRFREALCELL